MKRSSIDVMRENLRLQQVFNVFFRYGWDILFERWELIHDLRRRLQAWVWRLPPDLEPLTMPVKVRLMLEDLGPTYVKMGQIVSSQASVIPPEWAVELEKLQSNVPPFPSHQVRERLIEDLGQPPERLFASFELEPFAAASTAQVHRATLHNGQKVAVKVQRPYIRNQMKADLGIMINAARVVSQRSEYVRAIDLVGMLDQFSSSVLAELDYTGEAYNALKLSENMSGISGVHLPIVYPDLSTPSVLTMEFVEGVKISNIEAIEAAGLDRTALAKTALRAMVKQLMIDGFFHADPHPGNVLVNLKTGDITFLDTGMVGELDLNQRLNLIQLLFAVQQVDIPGMAQILRNMSTPFVDKVDEKSYMRDFERKIGRYFYAGSTVDFGQIVSTSLDLLREHGLRLDPNLTMAVKAMMQAEAISNVLYPQGGIAADGVGIIREMAVQEITADKIVDVVKQQAVMSARELFKRLPTLQEATTRWLDQYQKGRFEVYVDTSALAKEVNKISSLGRQIVIALILVGMIIGSAIATGILASAPDESGVWEPLYRLSYLGFLFSMVVAMIIVTRLVWRWLRGAKPESD